jgi:hypothetical protein
VDEVAGVDKLARPRARALLAPGEEAGLVADDVQVVT